MSMQQAKPAISGGALAKESVAKKLKKNIPFYVIFAPVLLWYILFSYAPMAGVVIAFKDYNFADGIFGSQWVGLEYVKQFVTNGDFWIVFRNTIIISAMRIAVCFPTPIIFALLLNEVHNNKFKKVVQTVSYLPHFISWVIVSGILFSFFASDGVVNKVINLFGGETVNFLSSEKYFRWFLVLSAAWKDLGWSAIIYLAALSGLDAQLYEAAMLDGASRWKQLWHITLPSIRSVVSVMFIMSFSNVLSAGFDQVLVMINPAVTSVAETIDYYVYRVGLQQVNNYSYATAVGLFKSLLSLALVLITNYGSKKIDEEGGLW